MITQGHSEALVERHPELPDSFVAHVLQPYERKKTIYIKRAWIETEAGATSAVKGAIRGRAHFSIPESCYIDATGHFNAVEFILCFNQLAYVYGAYLAGRGLLLGSSNIGEFKANQLAGMLITEVKSRFSRPIDSRSFEGEVRIDTPEEENAKYWRQIYYIRFWDTAGGNAEGAITTAILKPERVSPGKV
jgi:(3R)-3-[(carboxylmethyl)amino]fatty acid synthase